MSAINIFRSYFLSFNRPSSQTETANASPQEGASKPELEAKIQALTEQKVQIESTISGSNSLVGSLITGLTTISTHHIGGLDQAKALLIQHELKESLFGADLQTSIESMPKTTAEEKRALNAAMHNAARDKASNLTTKLESKTTILHHLQEGSRQFQECLTPNQLLTGDAKNFARIMYDKYFAETAEMRGHGNFNGTIDAVYREKIKHDPKSTEYTRSDSKQKEMTENIQPQLKKMKAILEFCGEVVSNRLSEECKSTLNDIFLEAPAKIDALKIEIREIESDIETANLECSARGSIHLKIDNLLLNKISLESAKTELDSVTNKIREAQQELDGLA
ncbi:MAG: hypothetical protein FJZ57_06450 [Chlamydiae bacterium]|nr:hypothetical protein [Chlamydiota bacterium]